MQVNWMRAVAAGAVGTAIMTAVGVWLAPMMGMPLFSGSAAMAIGSFVGHLVYGGVVGAIYGHPAESVARPGEPVAVRHVR
jgi:hypothetical protein